MRLKLSGPDYKNQDPVAALQDFKKRITMYEKKYVPLGETEERQGFSYCQMIDVGRKFITHNISGFLSTQVVNYLQHFNLAARRIWITRHEESEIDCSGGIAGDAGLSPYGTKYADALANFIDHERDAWARRQSSASFAADDDPNQEDGSVHLDRDGSEKTFHVWTSETQRGVQTARSFNSSRYDIEHMHMLDGPSTGTFRRSNEHELKQIYTSECAEPPMGQFRPGYSSIRGDGYLGLTKRLQLVILEMERVTGHVLLIGELAVTRVLLAYCKGMDKNDIADLDVPLGTLYVLEPVTAALFFAGIRCMADSRYRNLTGSITRSSSTIPVRDGSTKGEETEHVAQLSGHFIQQILSQQHCFMAFSELVAGGVA